MEHATRGSQQFVNFSTEGIAQRAYELYMARGGSHGRGVDDWLRAESELTRGGLRQPSGGYDDVLG
jgi:hypothetical protein